MNSCSALSYLFAHRKDWSLKNAVLNAWLVRPLNLAAVPCSWFVTGSSCVLRAGVSVGHLRHVIVDCTLLVPPIISAGCAMCACESRAGHMKLSLALRFVTCDTDECYTLGTISNLPKHVLFPGHGRTGRVLVGSS
jgi:hypothetical protein